MELQSFSSIVSNQPILNPLKIKVYEISLAWVTVTFSVHIEANSCGFAQDVFCSIFCYARTIKVLMQIHIAGPNLWSQALEISFPHALTPVSMLVCHLELGWMPYFKLPFLCLKWIGVFSSLPRNRHRTDKMSRNILFKIYPQLLES